jgi:hypothetical protein
VEDRAKGPSSTTRFEGRAVDFGAVEQLCGIGIATRGGRLAAVGERVPGTRSQVQSGGWWYNAGLVLVRLGARAVDSKARQSKARQSKARQGDLEPGLRTDR